MDPSAPHEPSPDHPDVIMFPPLLPIIGFALGVAIDRLTPLANAIPAGVSGVLRGLGGALLAAGVCGFAWMVVTMKRARTPIKTSAAPTALVDWGPFGISRNPMYLFGTAAYLGLALVLMAPGPLLLLPAVTIATHFGVVLREESFLASRFGLAYERYKTRVPRWL